MNIINITSTSNYFTLSAQDETERGLTKVASCQIKPIIGEKKKNISNIQVHIEEASAKGAEIIAFPELANTGYVFETRKEAYSLAEGIPGGETSDTVEELARRRQVYVALGIAEKEQNNLYNSSVLFGPQGFIGKYRKLHLWNKEKLFFEPGDLGLPVFNTELGRLAMYICRDMWFPESTRIYALQGADVVLNLTNWVASTLSPRVVGLYHSVCIAESHVNTLPMVVADRVGTERGQPFLGASIIVDPNGAIVAGPASMENEEIIYGKLNLMESRSMKTKTQLNHALHDRRTDVYDSMLGYKR